jgi:thiol-disulfide isomerase/thioredoxin
MKLNTILFLIIAIAMPIISYSQTSENTSFYNDTLKGLRKETKQDSLAPSMKLDGTIPIYDANGKKIGAMEVIKAMQSGEGVPVRYINDSKEIKAYVLRPTTDEEKQKIKDKIKKIGATKNQMVGKAAKPFTVKDMFGKTYSLKSLKGKVVVLNFWFVECMPCIKEMPELNNLVKKYKGKDVVFLAIANSDKAKILKFQKKNSFKYIIAPKGDKDTVIENYNINAYPTHIIIDKNSNVSFYAEGLDATTLATINATLDTLLK